MPRRSQIAAARDAVDDLLADPSGDLLADELNERLEGAAVLVVGCPAEIVLEAVCQLPSASVRVVASEASRWAAVRGFAAVVAEASGWDFEEAPEALEGAAVVLLEALAAGPVGIVAAPGSRSLVEAAREASVPVWAVVGAGRVLHPQLLDEMLQRAGDSVDLVLPGVIEAVIGPSGLGTPAEGLGRQMLPAGTRTVDTCWLSSSRAVRKATKTRASAGGVVLIGAESML